MSCANLQSKSPRLLNTYEKLAQAAQRKKEASQKKQESSPLAGVSDCGFVPLAQWDASSSPAMSSSSCSSASHPPAAPQHLSHLKDKAQKGISLQMEGLQEQINKQVNLNGVKEALIQNLGDTKLWCVYFLGQGSVFYV